MRNKDEDFMPEVSNPPNSVCSSRTVEIAWEDNFCLRNLKEKLRS
jgi:hypothetical protein